nr:zinc finger, CCHC-type, retrotransposon Gag domain protein [Tanacetum cinerariifolium]
MVNTRTDAELAAAVQNALQTLFPQIRAEIREEFCTGSGPSGSSGNPPPVTIHTWLERFNKQKPRSFEKATAPVDEENWISHMEKIIDVMGYEDAFKTRLAVYMFEGDALAWWKAYKQAKGGDVGLITVTWAKFKELFFLQFFPQAEQERLKREYHSICQTDTETSTEFMQRFLRLAGFLEAAAGTAEEQAKNFQLPKLLATMRSSMRGMTMALGDQTRGRRVLIGISRPLNRVLTGTTVIIMTIMDQTGKAVVTTTAATTTTLATTTGVLVMGVTKEIGVSSPTNLSILVSSSLGVPLRATPTWSALRVDADTQESVVELLADKKPGTSGRVFAITEDHATKTSG